MEHILAVFSGRSGLVQRIELRCAHHDHRKSAGHQPDAMGATRKGGATGALGATGATGVTGGVGGTGATGVAGGVGATGATGPAGATGSGSTGATGSAGSAGGVGSTGATGPVGATGSGGGGGALVLLEEHTASSSASLAFTSWYSASYDEYMIEFVNVIPATNNVGLAVNFSVNGGSSYDTSTIYDWTQIYSYGSSSGAMEQIINPPEMCLAT